MATQDIPEVVTQRVLFRVKREGTCIVSTYSRGSHGYAQVGWTEPGAKRSTMALCHRVVWIAAHGRIPEGMHVDHICRNRPCINIDHLQLLTHAENSAQGGATMRERYTHCKRGHDMAVYGMVAGDRRYCGECTRIRYRLRKLAEDGAR